MRQAPGLVEVNSTASLVQPEVLIKPNPARAADLGVSVTSIARTASLATLGDSDSNLADFDIGDRQIPIRVRLDPDSTSDLSTLENLQVPGQNGQMVPLVAVADIEFGSGPAQIDRYNRSRQVTVSANLQGITLGQAVEAVAELPVMQNLPDGVREQSTGDAEIQQEVFSRFGLALGDCNLDDLCSASAAVQRLFVSLCRDGSAAAVRRRGPNGPIDRSKADGTVCPNWDCAVDWPSDKKLDFAGGLCTNCGERRQVAATGRNRSGHYSIASDFDDLDFDRSWDGADRIRNWSRW